MTLLKHNCDFCGGFKEEFDSVELFSTNGNGIPTSITHVALSKQVCVKDKKVTLDFLSMCKYCYPLIFDMLKEMKV